MKSKSNDFLTKVLKQYSETDKLSRIYVMIVLISIFITSILGFTLAVDSSEVGVIILSTISSLTGVLCVFGLANKNYMGYFGGIIQVITYGIVAINGLVGGQVFLSFLIYLPANSLGFLLGQKNNETNYVVKSKRLEYSELIKFTIATIVVSISTVLIFIFLTNDAMPVLDGLITSLALMGTILMVTRYSEQGGYGNIVNILTVIMFFIFYFETGAIEYIPQIIMGVFTLLNSIYGLLIGTNVLTIETINKPQRIQGSNGYKVNRKKKIKINIPNKKQ